MWVSYIWWHFVSDDLNFFTEKWNNNNILEEGGKKGKKHARYDFDIKSKYYYLFRSRITSNETSERRNINLEKRSWRFRINTMWFGILLWIKLILKYVIRTRTRTRTRTHFVQCRREVSERDKNELWKRFCFNVFVHKINICIHVSVFSSSYFDMCVSFGVVAVFSSSNW